MKVLRHCFPNNLGRVLEELPQSLDETYQRILKEINNANQKQAHQLLQCLAVARRPLRVEELAEVLALDIDARGIPTFNAKWRWEDHEAAVLSACSSLVSVIIDHGSHWVVQFSHFSVKEFLTSDRLASMEDVSQFHITDEPSHLILAQACVGVLLSVYDRTSEDSVEDIALLPYAKQYLVEHTHVGKVELRIQDALDCFFDVSKPHFEAFFRREGHDDDLQVFRIPSDEDPKGVLSPAAPFFLAGMTGLSGLAERLIATNQPQVTGFRLHGWTLLHLMVEENKIEVARLLLAHGADINSRPDYANPPHIASLQSHVERPVVGSLEEIEEIEKNLQNRDVDVSPEESPDDGTILRYGRKLQRKSGFTPLHIAVKEGYLDMCQMLLEHNPDVRATDNEGNTPLLLALSDNNFETSRILLEYNAEVNSRNKDGYTPLLIASSNGNIDLFRLLLAHNADVFVHGYMGNTPLHFAVSKCHIEMARMLLERKVDANSSNGEGLTPLQQASEVWYDGYLDIVRLLLDYGANVNVHDNDRNTPLHFAVSGGCLEIARMLLERKADVDILNNKGLTPLHRASKGWHDGYPDIVRLLLDYGANANAHDDDRNTPLHFAASKCHLEVTRMLLERKADIDSLNSNGLTPLHRASEGWHEGFLGVVQLLLYHGANVNVHDNDRNTPLHFAASEGHPEVVRVLLEHKADVNAMNKEGLTPLHRTFERRRGDIARLLLNHGADTKVHDKSGNTLLHLAALAGDFELARISLEHIAEVVNSQNDDGSSPFLLALECRNTDVAQLLLEHNADVHMYGKYGDTPLHIAVRTGDLNVCRILLERKVEVNCKNDHGSTPLLLASELGTPDLMQLLLDHHADVNVRDADGNTLLHCAAIAGQLEVARLVLLKLNVDINSRNEKGSTPLHLASAGYHWGRYPDIVRLLLDHGADTRARNLSGETASEVAQQQEIMQLLFENAGE